LKEDPFNKTSRKNNFFEEKRIALKKKDKERIIQRIQNYLTSLPEVKFAYAHGSFIEDLPFRDIDIAIYYENTLPKQKQLDLSLTLSAELTHRLRLPVDVHALNHASVSFQYYATRGLVVVSRNDEERYEFIENAWRVYMDYEPVLKENLRDLLAV